MKKKRDKLKSEKKLEGKQEGVKKWKRGEKKEKGFGLASETGSTLALSLPLRLYQFARFGKSVRGFPLVFGQPGQKLMIYPIHERYIFHTPFHGFLTTMSLPDAHQIFSGCRSHIRIISRQFVTQNEIIIIIIKMKNPITYLKRTLLRSLVPSRRATRVIYTPGSYCSIHSAST